MVERKKTEKEKKTVQIKATTGAWWKSKPSEEKVEAPASPSEDTKTVKPKRAPRAKKAVTPAPKAEKKPTRTPVKKKAKAKVKAKDPVKDIAAEEQGNIATPESKKSPESKKTPERKKAPVRKKAPESKKASESKEVLTGTEAPESKEVPVAPVRKKPAPRKRATKPRTPRAKAKPVVEDVAVVAASEVTSEAKVDVVAAEEVVEEVAAKPKSTKPRRGRRPKAAAKKKVVTEDADIAATTDEVVAEVAASTEVVDGKETEDTDASQDVKQKPGRKTSSQKKADGEENQQPQEEVKRNCKLLINAEEPEECRLALLEDGRLESLNVSTISRTQRKNNIYKARIVAIEPSLQAAFVEYGTDKNGFLPFSEIHPEYFKQDLSDQVQHLVDSQQWKKLSITDVVERGQEILAQVVKEEIGKKGANMTTFLSIPGRCVVLMPGSDSSGISRKISGEQRRSQLRETMKSMDLPEGIGWIVRTASVDITHEALTRDVGYLVKLWDDIKGKGQTIEGVGLVYEEQHSVLRFLREHFDPSIQEILVDDRTALEQVKEFIHLLPKSQQGVTVRLHQGARPIFNQFSVEDQIESIYQPQVSLPSGGSIVIDPTEALVAIDVNSGSTSKGKNFEASIFQANMEAAAELARQLRLRDLGGLIVVDFIDMRSRKNIIAVEKQVRAAMKKDKAKVDFSRISKFGLMEISRQKLGAPIEAGNYSRCEHCKGRGTVRSVETLSLFYLRRIQTGASRKPVDSVECHFPLDVSAYLLNKKRTEISEMEKRYDVEIIINAETHMKPAENEIIFHKAEKEQNNKKQA